MTISLGQTVLFNDLTPARVVSTSNIAGTYYNGPNNNGVGATLTISSSSLTIDGVLLYPGDRVLLQNQTSSYQNGIYIVDFVGLPFNASVVVLKRAFDHQCTEQMKAGQFIVIGAGSVYAGTIFSLIEPLPQQIGISAISFEPANNTQVPFEIPNQGQSVLQPVLITDGAVQFGTYSNGGQIILAAYEGGYVGYLTIKYVSNATNDCTMEFLDFANGNTINILGNFVSGISTSNVLCDGIAGQQMKNGTSLLLDKEAATETAGAVTIDHQSGVITTTSLTTAAGSSTTLTLTNTFISAGSVILLSLMGGSNTTPGVQLSASAGSGSSTITISNANSSSALNGTLIISFAVF